MGPRLEAWISLKDLSLDQLTRTVASKPEGDYGRAADLEFLRRQTMEIQKQTEHAKRAADAAQRYNLYMFIATMAMVITALATFYLALKP